MVLEDVLRDDGHLLDRHVIPLLGLIHFDIHLPVDVLLCSLWIMCRNHEVHGKTDVLRLRNSSRRRT